MTIDHIGTVRRSLDRIETALDETRRDNVKLRDAGFLLVNYLLSLSRGGKEPLDREAAKIREAIKLFGAR